MLAIKPLATNFLSDLELILSDPIASERFLKTHSGSESIDDVALEHFFSEVVAGLTVSESAAATMPKALLNNQAKSPWPARWVGLMVRDGYVTLKVKDHTSGAKISAAAVKRINSSLQKRRVANFVRSVTIHGLMKRLASGNPFWLPIVSYALVRILRTKLDFGTIYEIVPTAKGLALAKAVPEVVADPVKQPYTKPAPIIRKKIHVVPDQPSDAGIPLSKKLDVLSISRR